MMCLGAVASCREKHCTPYRQAQTHPCFHWDASRKSRQAKRISCFEYTASNSTHSTTVSGNSGSITFKTRKCLFLSIDFTAVHLVNSNFFGCYGFIFLSGLMAIPMRVTVY